MAPNSNVRFVGQARFDETNFNLRRTDFYATGNYGPLVAQLSYSYTAPDSSVDDTSAQQDIVASLWLQLSDRWSLGGMIRYDIDEDDVRQDALSLRYADECHVLTVTYVDSNIADIANGINKDQSIMFRFEFKHLGDFRYKTNVLDFDGADKQ